MRRIAIVGSGQAGLICAHALLQARYEVTLYSDRTAEQWLNESRPTGTAARFGMSVAYERELGLEHWGEKAPKLEGLYMTLCPDRGKRLLTLSGRFNNFGLAIDLRLQCHRWLNDFEAMGGNLVIESVTVDRLDEVTEDYELTIVAAGRADLCNLFERDAERSVYDRPQRNLAMVVTKGGPAGFEGINYSTPKVNIFPPYGEMFLVPYYHKDHGPAWNMLFEAKAGGPMDRFSEAENGEQAVEIAKQVISDLAPWDAAWCKDMELADEHGWLAGAFPPTVRRPVGRLPSGRVVTALGDTAMALDPIGAQGANNGNKMARNLVEAILARRGGPFDEAWMIKTFEAFYRQHGYITYAFNNSQLEPATAAMKEILIAQIGSDGSVDSLSGKQAIANDLCNNFDDPNLLTDKFHDLKAARRYIREKTGRPWIISALAGRFAVAKGQLRRNAA